VLKMASKSITALQSKIGHVRRDNIREWWLLKSKSSYS
jgi:hypothetical protein